jgi:hypothetical protein
VSKHHGPHCAIGSISYPNRGEGILIYIKASLTGDENDYVFDYKKRYSAFPHETTLDQLFTEEQFEAYRALGFHAAFRLFDGSDKFAHLDPARNAGVETQMALIDQLFPQTQDGQGQARGGSFAARLSDATKAAMPAKPAPNRRRRTKRSASDGENSASA